MLNTVRITSGQYRGRTIDTPGGKTHPMGERERLALFNMIAGYLKGKSVLDTFAGSGALGFEALSRGAKNAVFIDNDKKVCSVIVKNAEKLGVLPLCEVRGDNVYTTLQDTVNMWDVVLADPPYDAYDPEKIKVLAKAVTDQGGILVLSHPGEAPEMPGLTLEKSRRYAGATISVYTK